MEHFIDRYLDGELTEEEAEAFLVAVRENPDLEAELRAYEETLAFAADTNPPGPSPDFTDQVMNRIASMNRQPAPRLHYLSHLRSLFGPTRAARLAWAAVLVLVFGLGYLTSRLGTGGELGYPDRTRGSQTVSDAGSIERTQAVASLQSENFRIFRLVYAPQKSEVSGVAIAGTFNGWNPELTPMHQEGNVWTALLILPPDTYEYMIVENGDRWITDPLALQTRDDGFGRKNAVLDLTL